MQAAPLPVVSLDVSKATLAVCYQRGAHLHQLEVRNDKPGFTQLLQVCEPGVIWAAHYVGRDKEYCQIKKLANLDQLPPFGFRVACFPTKIKAGSVG